MPTIVSQKTGQISEDWKDGFLDLRKLKVIKYINKKNSMLPDFKTNKKE